MDQSTQLKESYISWMKKVNQSLTSTIMSIKVQQKLKIYEHSIDDIEVNPKDYSDVTPEEISQLTHQSKENQMNNYITIAMMFVKADVKGKIDIRGESGILWNSKNITFKPDLNVLEIERQSKNPPHQLYLKDYQIKWIGKQGTRYLFELSITNQKSNSKIKHMLLGEEIETNALMWFDQIKKRCSKFSEEANTPVDRIKSMNHRGTVAINGDGQALIRTQLESSGIKSSVVLQTQSARENNVRDDPIKAKEIKLHHHHKAEQKEQLVTQLPPPSPYPSPPKQTIPKALEFMQEYMGRQNLLSDYNHKMIYMKKNLRIMQNIENGLQFKSYIVLENIEPGQIIQSIVSVDEQFKWNFEIDSASKNLAIMADQCMLIVYEKRKKYGKLYLPREFVLMRHVLKNEEGVYILEKSINHEDHQERYQVIRGEVKFGIWGIFENKKQNSSSWTVVYHQHQTNGGYSSIYQDSQMSLKYLMQLEQLEQYLCQQSMAPIEFMMPMYLQKVFGENQQNISDISNNIIQLQLPALDVDVQDSQCSESIDSELNQDDYEQSRQFMLQVDEVKDNKEIKIQKVVSHQSENENYETFIKRLLGEIERETLLWSMAIHEYSLEPQESEAKVVKQTPEGHHFLWKDEWQIEEKGGLRFIHQKKIELQKDVFKFMLKSIGGNLLSGKSIMSISLPVNIFEKRSNLERHAAQFVYAPVFLEAVAASKDPLEQMKACIKFGQAAFMLYCNMDKPFNPILGETYQGIINGCPIYVEQTSHHPPICNFQFIGRGYTVTGHQEVQANMGPTKIIGCSVGFFKIKFIETGNSIIFNGAPGIITGITIGDRMFFQEGSSWFIDVKNKLLGSVSVSCYSSMFSKRNTPLDQMDGRIIRIEDSEIERFQKETYKKYQPPKEQQQQQQQKLCEITGRFTTSMYFDGQLVFDWNRDFPLLLENQINPLASDSIYREDIVAWKMDDFNLAQAKKEKLEVKQRADRKLRDKHGPKKKH